MAITPCRLFFVQDDVAEAASNADAAMVNQQLALLCSVLVPDVVTSDVSVNICQTPTVAHFTEKHTTQFSTDPQALQFLGHSFDAVGRTTGELAAFVIDMAPILRHDSLLQVGGGA